MTAHHDNARPPPTPPESDGTDGFDVEQLVNRFEKPLLRYVSQLLRGDPASCRDVVQDTFLKLHSLTRSKEHEAIRNVRQWLFRVAHNLAMDVQRKRRRRDQASDRLQQDPTLVERITHRGEPDARTQMMRSEEYAQTMEALGTLPPQEKQVVLLKVVENLTLREIGEITGLKIGTVHYRLTRALETLADTLDAE